MAQISRHGVGGRPLDPIHRFNRFEVHVAERRLLVDGSPARLGARAFDVLLTLIDRRDRLVTKNELLDAVWPAVVVEENNLTVQVSALRKLLGGDVIATIPGRGYRFTADPRPTHSPADPRLLPQAMRTNLPAVLAPLIGREDDLAALGVLLEAHRLVTIVGAGGMGKTRLAERLMHDRRDALEHGVAWIELAGLSDGALLVSTIAGAVGLQTGAGDPLKGLVSVLKPLSMFVALDNAEHVIDAVATVAQAILEGAPRVRLIVTSQGSLKVAGERVYRLGALAIPEPDVPFGEALSHGAIALFSARAQAADRRFQLTAGNLADVVEICGKLDGLALAIELAASRVPLLGVSGLAASLDERLQLLSDGRRGAPQRQRTLRAALEWSHALLDEAEAVVFRRLGVFAGGFSLDLARQVVADEALTASVPPLDEWLVVDALGSLVDRSLVATDTAALPRYRLLESARAFARERLAASPDDEAVRRRHAAATLRRFVAVDAACLEGKVRVDEALAALEPDLDNAREAMAWLMAEADVASAVTLAPALSFALNVPRYQERALLWEATAACVSDDLPASVRAAWALGYGGFWYRSKPALAAAWARRAADFFRDSGDTASLYRTLCILGIAGVRSRDRDEAAATYAEARRIENPAWSARMRFFGAVAGSGVALDLENVDEARSQAERAQRLANEIGDVPNSENMLVTLADLELAAGRIDAAVSHGLELVRRLQGTRYQTTLAFAQVNLIGALLAQGSVAQARAMSAAGWAMAVRFDIRHLMADNFALMAILEGRAVAAARLRGYGDALYASNGADREPNEARAVDQTDRLIRERIGTARFDDLRRQGSTLQDPEMAALALDSDDPKPRPGASAVQ